MKSEDFKCERCKRPASRLSLSADGEKWICPECALREARAAKLNAKQRAHLEEQLVERRQLVRRRAQAVLNFGHVRPEASA
ncbi:MAG TPA: hypothetical protein VN256_08260 [Pyrinomonadaceae bacterium]|nr:hypothetical protein [Pyrinomonadaceae bacterium]